MKRYYVSILRTVLSTVFLAGMSISAMGCKLPHFYIPISHLFD